MFFFSFTAGDKQVESSEMISVAGAASGCIFASTRSDMFLMEAAGDRRPNMLHEGMRT